MKYCVTGAAGFVASNIAIRLVDGDHMVVGVDNMINGRMSNLDKIAGNPLFRFVDGDLCDMDVCEDVCRGADYVLHQAALGSVPRSVEDPVATMRNNAVSTTNMLVAARHAGVKRFVHASSASVYGNVDNGLLTEDMPTRPHNPYAVSKLAAEEIARAFWRTYGFPTVCLRYFNVFGPRQNPEGAYAAVVPRFVGALMRSEAPTIYGDGEQSRDFTHVENVVVANLLACRAERGADGGAYNIAAGGFTTVNDLYGMISQAVGTVVDPIRAPARAGDVRGSRGSLTLASKVLGYVPKVGVFEGIRRTVAWYKNENEADSP
jgi:nucleoside-diphosphate-sugar epimerase